MRRRMPSRHQAVAERMAKAPPATRFHTPTSRLRINAGEAKIDGIGAAPSGLAGDRCDTRLRRGEMRSPVPLLYHRRDLICAGRRRTRQMLHELRTTMDLLGARGIAPLRVLAFPDCDRQELVVAAIEEQVAGNKSLALEGADVLRPFRNRGGGGAGLGT